MELYENRIINGILKANASKTPEAAASLLCRDVEVFVEHQRANENDLWPAIWAIGAVLERQFSGSIYIDAGLSGALKQPAKLNRCIFSGHSSSANPIRIYLGCEPPVNDRALCGDARSSTIVFGSADTSVEKASPLSCFALAGYLGFAALAQAVGLPPYRRDFARHRLLLPFQAQEIPVFPDRGFDLIGLGHLGQAYMALLFFITQRQKTPMRLRLYDKGYFEDPNWATQILIESSNQWIGCQKSDYLETRARGWGWDVRGDFVEVGWGWCATEGASQMALLGLDRFEVRRMAIAGGYRWIFDAGLGDSFLRPRVSWHSIPPDNQLARSIFPDDFEVSAKESNGSSTLIEKLRATPGGCGLLMYEQVQASVPALGIVAAAFLWSEILLYLSGDQRVIRGSATLWSPILPPLRTIVPTDVA